MQILIRRIFIIALVTMLCSTVAVGEKNSQLKHKRSKIVKIERVYPGGISVENLDDSINAIITGYVPAFPSMSPKVDLSTILDIFSEDEILVDYTYNTDKFPSESFNWYFPRYKYVLSSNTERGIHIEYEGNIPTYERLCAKLNQERDDPYVKHAVFQVGVKEGLVHSLLGTILYCFV